MIPRKKKMKPSSASATKSVDKAMGSNNSLAEQLRLMAAGTEQAARMRHLGDEYGQALSAARAGVYRAAAEIVETLSEQDALAKMIENTKREKVGDQPPLLGFDDAGLRYAKARAWQFCARLISPELPEIQKSW